MEKLSNLRNEITSASVDPNKKNSYILAIGSTEKTLKLLESVLDQKDLASIVKSILESKDAYQEILLQWNAEGASTGGTTGGTTIGTTGGVTGGTTGGATGGTTAGTTAGTTTGEYPSKESNCSPT
jgi:hypothetical protein